MDLYDILDRDELTAALANNHVRAQTHPSEPLVVLNYTELCAYGEVWNATTLTCRGLIYRSDTHEVVARGFVKFFNYLQNGAADIPLDARVIVTDKADGSLGIIFPLPSGGWAVSTRGSFASDQAVHATKVLRERYPDYHHPAPGITTLVEIVFPDNRIVLDYAGLDDLILLGGVEIATGAVHDVSRFADWPGPATTTFEAATLADALAMEPRPNAEGVVVRDLETGAMTKIKQADYVELHRIVTNLTARKIHEWMVAGKAIADFIAPLPDEFHAWCREVADGITSEVDAECVRMEEAFKAAVARMPADWLPGDRAGRKDFAMVAAKQPQSWALFALLDGRDIRPELLRRAEPGPFQTPTGRTYIEDNA